jgi:hypothetical protein
VKVTRTQAIGILLLAVLFLLVLLLRYRNLLG